MNAVTHHRDPVEELAADFADRLRRGETPSIEDYARRYPDWADEIRELFPTVAAMERLRVKKEQHSQGGHVSFGPHKIEQLGDFRIISEIGRGGMGVVYEAEQESLGRRVAVKVLPRQFLTDAAAVERFRREAQTAARLRHTNIVPVFGVGEQDGFHYYVMQLVDGVPLDVASAPLTPPPSAAGQETNRRPDASDANAMTEPLPQRTQRADYVPPVTQLPSEPRKLRAVHPREVARIGIQVANALQYAHDQGVLHRDVKPGNLLMDRDGVVLVTDFGLAKLVEGNDASKSEHIVGTLRYMAPEQFDGRADSRCDQYSLGITLYELATREPAFSVRDRGSVIDAICTGRLPAPRDIDPTIPRDLETIILKAISVDPSARYPSAGHLAVDLENFLADRPINARRFSAVERLARWGKRNQALAATSATAILLLLVMTIGSTIGYLQIQTALRGETDQRTRAEATLNLTLAAIDRTFDRFIHDPLGSGQLNVPSDMLLSTESALILQDLLQVYDDLADQEQDDPVLRRKAAEAQRRVAFIRMRLGQHDEALEAYQVALERFKALNTHGEFDRQQAQIHNEIGGAYRITGRRDEALQSHREALAILERLQPDETVRYEIARTNFLLVRRIRPGKGPFTFPIFNGPPLGGRGDGPPSPPVDPPQQPWAGDPSYLHAAVAILEKLSAEHPEAAAYRHLLAVCYRELAGDFLQRRTATDEELDNKAIQLLTQLVQENPEVPDYLHDLVDTLGELVVHGPGVDERMLTKAEKRFREAKTYAEQLVESRPDVAEYAESLSHVCFRLGTTFERLGHYQGGNRHAEIGQEIEQCYLRAMIVETSLVKQFPQATGYAMWLSLFQESLARVWHEQGKLPESREVLQQAIKLLRERETPEADRAAIETRIAALQRSLNRTLRDFDDPSGPRRRPPPPPR